MQTIISFLGTLGAYREIRCMLITFFVILFMIFVVMLVGGILGYIFRNEVKYYSKPSVLALTLRAHTKLAGESASDPLSPSLSLHLS